MRGSLLGFVSFAFILYSGSCFLHWALFRWLRPLAPAWVRRHKWSILAVVGVFFFLPLARDISIVFPRLAAISSIAGLGMIWHVSVWMCAAVVGLARGTELLFTAIHGVARRRLGAAAAQAPAAGPLLDAPTALGAVTDRSGLTDRRMLLRQLGSTAAFAIPGAALTYGSLFGRYDWIIEEVPIRLARLPKALDGFTIVQISDLHVGTFVGERELTMGLGLIAGIRPDLIVITGDIVDVNARFIPLAARSLGALRAPHGTFCIPGNHDYYTGAGAVLDGMQRAGVEVMRNRGKIIAPDDGGGFALLGVDDLWARNRGGFGPDLARAQAMVVPSLATVLLAHQPTFVSRSTNAGIDLQLSGHTHGGQINPGFRPIDLFFHYVAGRYDVGPTQLYVNRGFGTAGPPTRLGAAPEITKIVLVAG